MSNFSFAVTWLNTGKVIGFYVLMSFIYGKSRLKVLIVRS